MKRCSYCQQTYSDETMFCLADGTPLKLVFDLPEDATLVRNNVQIPEGIPSQQKSGNSLIIWLLAGIVGLFVLLSAVGAVGFLVYSNSGTPSEKAKKEVASPFGNSSEIKDNKVSVPTPKIDATPTPDSEKEKIEKEKAELKEKQDSLEKERKRLEDERKKLEENKTKPENTPEKPVEKTYPPQQTARITFSRGSVSQTVSGRVGSERSFVLAARGGQYLSASVSSGGGCVTFRGGGTSAGFTTSSGDNRVTLVNNCASESSFSLTVAIR